VVFIVCSLFVCGFVVIFENGVHVCVACVCLCVVCVFLFGTVSVVLVCGVWIR